MGRAVEKKKHLVVYDYGAGGVWAVIIAEGPEEILAKFPQLTVARERPSWMTEAEYQKIETTSSFDIDADPPKWLSRRAV